MKTPTPFHGTWVLLLIWILAIFFVWEGHLALQFQRTAGRAFGRGFGIRRRCGAVIVVAANS